MDSALSCNMQNDKRLEERERTGWTVGKAFEKPPVCVKQCLWRQWMHMLTARCPMLLQPKSKWFSRGTCHTPEMP